MSEVTYDEAMEWLDKMLEEAEYGEAEIIEYIQEMLFQYNDIQNS